MIALKNNRCAGFTLIEVILIMVIVSLLGAMLVPSCIGYLREAHETGCQAEKALCEAHYESLYSLRRDMYTTQEILEQFEKENEAAQNTCPDGGTYTFVLSEGGTKITVTCSLHDKPNASPDPHFS